MDDDKGTRSRIIHLLDHVFRIEGFSYQTEEPPKGEEIEILKVADPLLYSFLFLFCLLGHRRTSHFHICGPGPIPSANLGNGLHILHGTY